MVLPPGKSGGLFFFRPRFRRSQDQQQGYCSNRAAEGSSPPHPPNAPPGCNPSSAIAPLLVSIRAGPPSSTAIWRGRAGIPHPAFLKHRMPAPRRAPRKVDERCRRGRCAWRGVWRDGTRVCRALAYNFIIKTSLGKTCHGVDRALGGLDDRWNDWTHGSNKRAPFDGFLPNDHTRYPGTEASSPVNLAVPGANHFTIAFHSNGVEGVKSGMRQIGMRPVNTTPPGDGGGGGGGGGNCTDPSTCIVPMRQPSGTTASPVLPAPARAATNACSDAGAVQAASRRAVQHTSGARSWRPRSPGAGVRRLRVAHASARVARRLVESAVELQLRAAGFGGRHDLRRER